MLKLARAKREGGVWHAEGVTTNIGSKRRQIKKEETLSKKMRKETPQVDSATFNPYTENLLIAQFCHMVTLTLGVMLVISDKEVSVTN